MGVLQPAPEGEVLGGQPNVIVDAWTSYKVADQA